MHCKHAHHRQVGNCLQTVTETDTKSKLGKTARKPSCTTTVSAIACAPVGSVADALGLQTRDDEGNASARVRRRHGRAVHELAPIQRVVGNGRDRTSRSTYRDPEVAVGAASQKWKQSCTLQVGFLSLTLRSPTPKANRNQLSGANSTRPTCPATSDQARHAHTKALWKTMCSCSRAQARAWCSPRPSVAPEDRRVRQECLSGSNGQRFTSDAQNHGVTGLVQLGRNQSSARCRGYKNIP